MDKKKFDIKNISKIARDILKEGPSNDVIIESILNEQSKKNNDIILRVSTNDISYEVFKGKSGKLNVVKGAKPNCKVAGSDFNKVMSKKEALKEIISFIVKDFFKNEKDYKGFLKELK